MEVEFLDAPDGVEATWYEAHGKLFIALAKDLDDVTRQRYITRAKREHGIEERRRRVAIPFILPAAGHRTAGQQTAVGAGAVVVAAAVVAAAAVMVPAALDNNSNQVSRRPAQAAAPPARPGPSGKPRKPTNPSSPPVPPKPSAESPQPPARTARHGHANPLSSLDAPTSLPSVPVHVPPVVKPTVPVTATTPEERRRICVRIQVVIQARIGCGTR